MRARNIKPGFFKNEELASCSFQTRLLFIGLWLLADREGRLEDRPHRIKAEIFPYDNVNIEKLLGEIAEKKDCDGSPSFIVRYGRTRKYIQILHFASHQHPHINEKESEIPDISTCTVQEPEPNDTSTVQKPDNSGVHPSESPLRNPESLNMNDEKQVSKKPADISKEVIAYLDEKAGARYRNTSGNKKHIQARIAEGYSMKDFQSVIDKKCAEWLGTEMQKYLRPETLFGAKFDGYLNQSAGGNNGRVQLRDSDKSGTNGDADSAGKIPEGFWA